MKTPKTTRSTCSTALLALSAVLVLSAHGQAAEVTPAEARAIAKDAAIYGFPVIDNYRVNFSYFFKPGTPEFKGPPNTIINVPRVYTPADTAIQTPNSDTPYSWLGADLRAEPLVLSVPEIESDRYYSLQFIDAYTYNFAYVGSRATGNGAGRFLLAGPNWSGETPPGIKTVILSETDINLVVYRTQLFDPSDLHNVESIQSKYTVQPLSAFLGRPAPAAAPAIDYVEPCTPEEERKSLKQFEVLNFVLQFCPTVPSEVALMERFAKIGVGAGKTFDATTFPPEVQKAMKQGLADAWLEFDGLVKRFNEGELTSGDVFGTRAHLNGNYAYRMAAAVLGIYGNSAEEAMYPVFRIDSDGKPLTGAHRYTIHFAKGQLPAVNAFWSLTMYELPQSLLVANPINRYLINSPMLPQLERDADGGVTLYVQHESPGEELESNWLPAPEGPFAVYMRLYWPKQAALDGTWRAPQAVAVK